MTACKKHYFLRVQLNFERQLINCSGGSNYHACKMLMNEALRCADGDTVGAWIDMLYYSSTETMEPGAFPKCETLGIQSTLTRSQSQVLEFLNGASVFDCPSTPSSSPLEAPPSSQVPHPPVMHPNLVCTLKSILSPSATDGDSQSSTSGDSCSRCTHSGVSDMAEAQEGSEMRADCSAKASSPESTSWPRNRNSKQSLQQEAVMVPLDWIHNRRPYQCAFQGCQRTFKNPQTMRMHHKTHFNDASSATKLEPATAAAAETVLCSGSTIKAGHNKKIPARCPTCCKTFVGLYELRRHFGRKHSEGEKRHACRKCAKRFHIEVDVRDHEKLCGEPIVCSGCGMKFAFKCNLVAHKRSRHPARQLDLEEMKDSRSFQFKHQ